MTNHQHDLEAARDQQLTRVWLGLFIAGFALLWLAITWAFHYYSSCSWLKAFYWSVQTFTTVGYGTGFNDFTDAQMWLCIIWMLTSALYWTSLANLAAARLAHALE